MLISHRAFVYSTSSGNYRTQIHPSGRLIVIQQPKAAHHHDVIGTEFHCTSRATTVTKPLHYFLTQCHKQTLTDLFFLKCFFIRASSISITILALPFIPDERLFYTSLLLLVISTVIHVLAHGGVGFQWEWSAFVRSGHILSFISLHIMRHS